MNPDVDFFKVSCETGYGIEAWTEWVAKQSEARRSGQ